MERKKIIQRLAVWTSGFILMGINSYLFIKNPLEIQLDRLILMLLIWPITCGIEGYLFRKNKVYRAIRNIVLPVNYIVIYLIISMCESLFFS